MVLIQNGLNKLVFACFIDREKEFDKVKYDVLLKQLHRVEVVYGIYWNQSAHAKTSQLTT